MANQGIAVTVIHLAGRLMERQLDATAGKLLERALREQGIEVLCGAAATEVHEDRVVLSTGETVAADLTIVAAGVRPETSLAERAGLEVGRGILVDDFLRTSAPGVWAVGECAEHHGVVPGLVGPALAMARAAGASVAGAPSAYLPGPTPTRLKVAGIELFCAGALEGDDEVVSLDTRAGEYSRWVYRDGRLAGAILLGDTRDAGAVVEELTTGVAPAADADPLVCACNGVRRSAILGCGETTVDGVRKATRAATGCGGCSGAVAALLEEPAFQLTTTTVDVVMRTSGGQTPKARLAGP